MAVRPCDSDLPFLQRSLKTVSGGCVSPWVIRTACRVAQIGVVKKCGGEGVRVVD